ncbi:MAG: tRNA lysidine(34) synthetase TilS [Kiritimatiellia bacterium]
MTQHKPHLPDQLAEQLQSLGLCRQGTKLIVAVSGGADSMALLHALAGLATPFSLELHICHMDHAIRAESKQDSEWVKQICVQHQLPCSTSRVDIPAAARASGNSIEMEARQQRYAFFQNIYQAEQADALLTAHNRNDQVETVLLNLARGCSPGSLTGMQRDSTRLDMRIIRPLLHIDRRDIVAYLADQNVTWREDSTNTDIHYKRNAIRHIILPSLRQHLNPQIENAILRCAQMATADENYFQTRAREAAKEISPLSRPNQIILQSYRTNPISIRLRVLTRWLRQYGIPTCYHDTIRRIDDLAMNGKAGNCIMLSPQHEIRHVYEYLALEPTSTTIESNRDYPLQANGKTQIPELACDVIIKSDHGYIPQPPQVPGTLPATCHIRPPKPGETLHIRTRREGDRIHMTGAIGSRKLQDIFTDAKVPEKQRGEIPLLVSGNGLIWVPGMRISRDWAVSAPGAPSLEITIVPLIRGQ